MLGGDVLSGGGADGVYVTYTLHEALLRLIWPQLFVGVG